MATVCNITRKQFAANAKPVSVKVDDTSIVAIAREFGTGSIGWYAGQKVTVKIDGVDVVCQVGLTLTVVGSKELPRE